MIFNKGNIWAPGGLEPPSCVQACLSGPCREGQAGGGASVPVGDLTRGGILLGSEMSGGSRIYFTGVFLPHTHPQEAGNVHRGDRARLSSHRRSLSRGCEPPGRRVSLLACVPLRCGGSLVPTTLTPEPSWAEEGAPGKEKVGPLDGNAQILGFRSSCVWDCREVLSFLAVRTERSGQV